MVIFSAQHRVGGWSVGSLVTGEGVSFQEAERVLLIMEWVRRCGHGGVG